MACSLLSQTVLSFLGRQVGREQNWSTGFPTFLSPPFLLRIDLSHRYLACHAQPPTPVSLFTVTAESLVRCMRGHKGLLGAEPRGHTLLLKPGRKRHTGEHSLSQILCRSSSPNPPTRFLPLCVAMAVTIHWECWLLQGSSRKLWIPVPVPQHCSTKWTTLSPTVPPPRAGKLLLAHLALRT